MRRLSLLLAASIPLLLACAAIARADGQLPTWTFDASDVGGDPYGVWQLVGGDPRAGGTTLIPTELVGLDLRFSSGRLMAGSHDLGYVVSSPIFNPLSVSPVDGQVGQYGDWIMRAQFGRIGSDYHLLLQTPVTSVVSIVVPAEEGFTTFNRRGVLVGKVDFAWLEQTLQALAVHFPANSLPVFISHNVVGYDARPDQCCIIGYHDAFGSGQTLVYSAYVTPRTFKGFPAVGISDVNALSHELAEWLNDPYISNLSPAWTTGDGLYGCSSYFEVGDPLVGSSFSMAGNPALNAGRKWHLQDEAFASWFLHDGEPATLAPDAARSQGLYSYAGSLSAPARGC